MAIQFVAATIGANSGTSTTMTLPAGVQDGDLLVAYAQVSGVAPTFGSGGATWATTPGVNNGQFDAGDQQRDWLTRMKIADSEPSSWALTWDGNSRAYAWVVLAFRLTDVATPLGTGSATEHSATTAHTSPARTGPAGGGVIVLRGHNGAVSYTPGSGFTEAADQNDGVNGGAQAEYQIAGGSLQSAATASASVDGVSVAFPVNPRPSRMSQSIILG